MHVCVCFDKAVKRSTIHVCVFSVGIYSFDQNEIEVLLFGEEEKNEISFQESVSKLSI